MGKGEDQICAAAGLGGMLGQSFRFSQCHPQYLERIQLVEAVDSSTWEYLLSGWAGDLSKLSPRAQAALLQEIAGVHNKVFADKPRLDGRCADYCSLLAHKLHEQKIEVRMVGGLYFDELYPGTTIEDLEQQVQDGEETEEIFDWGSHTWLEIEDQLIDPTAGQFFQNGESEWKHQFYLPSQLKMHSFLQAWDGPGVSLGGRVLYGPDGLRKKA